MSLRPLEKDIQRSCLQYLWLIGFMPIRVNSGAVTVPAAGGRRRRFVRMNSEDGCSDCLCVATDGRFVAVECKRPGEEATPKQLAFLDGVRRRLGLGLIVTGVDDLREQLRGAGYPV